MWIYPAAFIWCCWPGIVACLCLPWGSVHASDVYGCQLSTLQHLITSVNLMSVWGQGKYLQEEVLWLKYYMFQAGGEAVIFQPLELLSTFILYGQHNCLSCSQYFKIYIWDDCVCIAMYKGTLLDFTCSLTY